MPGMLPYFLPASLETVVQADADQGRGGGFSICPIYSYLLRVYRAYNELLPPVVWSSGGMLGTAISAISLLLPRYFAEKVMGFEKNKTILAVPFFIRLISPLSDASFCAALNLWKFRGITVPAMRTHHNSCLSAIIKICYAFQGKRDYFACALFESFGFFIHGQFVHRMSSRRLSFLRYQCLNDVRKSEYTTQLSAHQTIDVAGERRFRFLRCV